MMFDEDESRQKPVCEEMRWLYGLVANNLDGAGVSSSNLDVHKFKQLRPEPELGKELLMRLDVLATQVQTMKEQKEKTRQVAEEA